MIFCQQFCDIIFDVVTNAWEQRKLFDVIEFSVSNNTLSRAELNYDYGEIKNIHYGDILVKFGAIVDIKSENIPFINKGKLEAYKNQLLKNGDVILADTAEDESAGKAIEIIGISEYCQVVSGLHTIVGRPKIEFASKFLGYYLNSPSYRKQLLKLMQGIKVFSLSKSNVSKTDILFPKLEIEQYKISKFLYSLDYQITLQQHKPKCFINLIQIMNASQDQDLDFQVLG